MPDENTEALGSDLSGGLGRWIPIVEKMPSGGERVNVFREGWAEDRATAWWSPLMNEWVPVSGFSFPGVTHWMPLPEPPAV